ncbi:hypothetical protein HU200_033597 [Digitaria exilis]|uniref:RNase H type-1 domain-containing protein n=1 Tax=Digitaria exilis TaxID=1010633 RepID=A0A835BV05_9POAL|nr:hypothetical protein HU200_033597 [Digitaria exilis]
MQQMHTWRPPPEGMMKLNCDGGFYAKNMTGSTSAVLRSSEGSFLGAVMRGIPSMSSALVAEAEACRDGLRLTLMRGGPEHVILESDSLQLVSLWKGRCKQRSEIATILRSINGAAHLCAKNASSCSPSPQWYSQPPSFLLATLQSDCIASE